MQLATTPQIPDRRWRQGSVIPHQALEAHLLPVVDPEALYILLTQDCDILHHDYDTEPSIELHMARPATGEDGNLLHAKNPRRLQFTTGGRLYEINMHERCLAPRACLLGHVPRELILEED